jgi:hypothetical protein
MVFVSDTELFINELICANIYKYIIDKISNKKDTINIRYTIYQLHNINENKLNIINYTWKQTVHNNKSDILKYHVERLIQDYCPNYDLHKNKIYNNINNQINKDTNKEIINLWENILIKIYYSNINTSTSTSKLNNNMVDFIEKNLLELNSLKSNIFNLEEENSNIYIDIKYLVPYMY